MKIYELALHVEEIQDGGETAEEVSSLAPSVAGALIASLQAEGDP